jgi:hypothetical protein
MRVFPEEEKTCISEGRDEDAGDTCLGGGVRGYGTTENQAYNALSSLDMKTAGLRVLPKKDLG